MPIQHAVAWWCFVPRLMTPAAFVRSVAELGYQAIDLAPAEYWPLIRDHGLAISAVGGHQSIAEGLNRQANHERIERELAEQIRLAEQWHIPNLICFSGNRAGLSDSAGLEVCAEGLHRVAGMAEQAGVNLVVELLNSKVDHADYQCDRTEWGVQLCQMVGSPRVRLLYDIYHMQIMEGDIIRTIEQYHQWFAHYHTAGNPGRHEIDQSQELYYPAIVRAMAATGYHGYLAQEFIPRGDPVEALRQALALCTI
ncbi:MAG: TIM barrel protein [Roseiflexaceae bacterium]